MVIILAYRLCLDSHMQIVIVDFYMAIVYNLNLHLVVHELDEKNWVVDFGGLKSLKNGWKIILIHKMILDKNDPTWKTQRD